MLACLRGTELAAIRTGSKESQAARYAPGEEPVPHMRNLPYLGVNMEPTNDEKHWARTSRLMWTHLGVWFFFGFIIHMFVVPLNKIVIPILGFPLGFYMAAQGSLIVFVVMLFLFARQQNKIDREFGVAEED